jgi:hypothetical protein
MRGSNRSWRAIGALAALSVVSAVPAGARQVMGGRAVTLDVRPEDDAFAGSWLLLTAEVRRPALFEVVLGRRPGRAAAPSGLADPLGTSRQLAFAAAAALVKPLVVDAIDADSVADKAGLKVGDIIGEVDGVTPSAVAIDFALQEQRSVLLRVVRGDAVHFINLFPSTSSDSGLHLRAAELRDAPVVDTGAVQGTSAGLLFALIDVDLMTSGDLTGGRRIAATGVILGDGTVEPVEAYEVKLKAAHRARADAVLTPFGVDEVRAQELASGTSVLTVQSLGHALWTLCAAGGRSSFCGNTPAT